MVPILVSILKINLGSSYNLGQFNTNYIGLRNVNFFQNIFFLKENEDSGGTFENISIVEM
jgi:hypothetical protein